MDPNANNNQPNALPPDYQQPVVVHPPDTIIQPTNSQVAPPPIDNLSSTQQPKVLPSENFFQPDAYSQPYIASTNKKNGILSIVFSVIGLGPIGLVLGIIGMKKAKVIGQKDKLSLIGTILGAVVSVAMIIVIVAIVSALSASNKNCNGLNSDSQEQSTTSASCNSGSTTEKTY